MNGLPISIDNYIPHKLPLKMVDTIIEFDDEKKSSIIELVVNTDSPFVSSDTSLDPECFLEFIAQAAAAQHGFNLERTGKQNEKGLLVGVRNFNIYGKVFSGDKLSVKIECGTEIESVSSVSGTVFKGDKKMASSVITVWHTS